MFVEHFKLITSHFGVNFRRTKDNILQIDMKSTGIQTYLIIRKILTDELTSV